MDFNSFFKPYNGYMANGELNLTNVKTNAPKNNILQNNIPQNNMPQNGNMTNWKSEFANIIKKNQQQNQHQLSDKNIPQNRSIGSTINRPIASSLDKPMTNLDYDLANIRKNNPGKNIVLYSDNDNSYYNQIFMPDTIRVKVDSFNKDQIMDMSFN